MNNNKAKVNTSKICSIQLAADQSVEPDRGGAPSDIRANSSVSGMGDFKVSTFAIVGSEPILSTGIEEIANQIIEKK